MQDLLDKHRVVAYALGATSLCIGCLALYRTLRPRLPPPGELLNSRTPEPLPDGYKLRAVRPTMDRYKTSKVPPGVDAVVVGSGMSALVSAGFLARAGWRIICLEQHEIAGGCLHEFEEHGVIWPTGEHYLGDSFERGKDLMALISSPPIEYVKNDGARDGRFVYDRVAIGSGRATTMVDGDGIAAYESTQDLKYYDLCGNGYDSFIDELARQFPQEPRANIEAYMEHAKRVARMSTFFTLKALPSSYNWFSSFAWRAFRYLFFLLKEGWTGSRLYYDSVRSSAEEVTRRFIQSPRLRAVLLAEFGDYGAAPSKTPFLMHAQVLVHYARGGGWSTKGGSLSMVERIVPVIERTGGRVLTQARVTKIYTINGTVTGVMVNDEDFIECDVVISTAGLANTIDLVGANALPRALVDFSARHKPSITMFNLFVKLKGSSKELCLPSYNIWSFPVDCSDASDGDVDYDSLLSDYEHDPQHAPMLTFIGFPSAKNETMWEEDEKLKGKSGAVVLTFGRYEWFEQWRQAKQGKRGDEYEQKKAMFTRRLTEELLRHFPHLESKIEDVFCGSPLTYEHYLGAKSGSVYGMEFSVERFLPTLFVAGADDFLRPRTSIRGLFLSGQDILSMGIAGARMAGLLTVQCVLGYDSIGAIASGRGFFVEDLLKAEAKKATATATEDNN